MNFSVKVVGFKKAISNIVDVSVKDAVKESVGEDKIILSADTQYISASAFNGRIAISEDLSDINNDNLCYKFSDPGEVVLNSKDLMRVLDSFAPDEIVIFETDKSNSEITIKKEKDHDQYQTLPCYSETITFPKEATSFEKDIEIRKDVLLAGIDRVFFVIGFEEEREKYLHWVIRSYKDGVRFAAGTGSIFSVVNFDGSDIVTSKPVDSDMLFPKIHTPVVQKILSSLICEKIKIKQSSSTDSSSPYQIVIEAGSVVMTLVGMKPDIAWVDENKFLDMKYDSKMVMDISDFSWASRGVMATFNDDMSKSNRISKSIVNIDPSKSLITVETKDLLKALRKVNIKDYVSSSGQNKDHKFICSSTYLSDMTKFSSKTKNIQIEMFSGDINKPIMIRYYANDKVSEQNDMKNQNNMAGITEKLNMFFVQLQD